MKFIALSHKALLDLRKKGYNVLKSVSVWGDESPTYRPARIEGNISEYLMKMQMRGKLTPDQHFLTIEEALSIPEKELVGVVWDE